MKKAADCLESNDILASTQKYDLSATAIHSILTESRRFSEEAFNGFVSFLQQPNVVIFDTMTSSIVLANIYNHDRVRELFGKRSVTLEGNPTLVFPIVDINGAVQLIIADLSEHIVTLYRDHEQRGGLTNKPGVQFTAFFDRLLEEEAWSLNDVHESGLTFKHAKSTQALVERMQSIVYSDIKRIEPFSLLTGRAI